MWGSSMITGVFLSLWTYTLVGAAHTKLKQCNNSPRPVDPKTVKVTTSTHICYEKDPSVLNFVRPELHAKWNFTAPSEVNEDDLVCVFKIYTPSQNASGQGAVFKSITKRHFYSHYKNVHQKRTIKKGKNLDLECSSKIYAKFVKGEKGFFTVDLKTDGLTGKDGYCVMKDIKIANTFHDYDCEDEDDEDEEEEGEDGKKTGKNDDDDDNDDENDDDSEEDDEKKDKDDKEGKKKEEDEDKENEKENKKKEKEKDKKDSKKKEKEENDDDKKKDDDNDDNSKKDNKKKETEVDKETNKSNQTEKPE